MLILFTISDDTRVLLNIGLRQDSDRFCAICIYSVPATLISPSLYLTGDLPTLLN